MPSYWKLPKMRNRIGDVIDAAAIPCWICLAVTLVASMLAVLTVGVTSLIDGDYALGALTSLSALAILCKLIALTIGFIRDE